MSDRLHQLTVSSCSYSCNGRCGAGCSGASLGNAYTQDCFSHDICSYFNSASGGARFVAFFLSSMVYLLIVAVTRTAALLTTPPSMTLPLVSRMVVGSPTRAILSLSQAVGPHVYRTKLGTTELQCSQQRNEFIISLSIYSVHHEHCQIKPSSSASASCKANTTHTPKQY